MGAGSEVSPATVLSLVGGPRGLLDSTVPTALFVLGLTLGGLRVGVAVALGAGVVLLIVRLVRREPVQPAVSGLFGVGLAALVSLWIGSAKGFFLPGIVASAVYGVLMLVSVLAGRPVVGYAAAALDARYAPWRDVRAMRRAANLATLVWFTIFTARTVVQGLFYLAGRPGWLGVMRIAMGWPLTALAVGASVLLLRRTVHGLPQPAADAAPSAEDIRSAADDPELR